MFTKKLLLARYREIEPHFQSLENHLLETAALARLIEELSDIKELKTVFDSKIPSSIPFGKNDLSKENPAQLLEHFHLWIRMLYSCLVDADFLDTEAFMAPEQSELRGNYASLSELKKKFDSYMAEKSRTVVPSKINQIRSSILQSCRKKGKLKPEFYSLNVPTGGGKTLSSMAFALEHALANNKKKNHHGNSVHKHNRTDCKSVQIWN